LQIELSLKADVVSRKVKFGLQKKYFMIVQQDSSSNNPLNSGQSAQQPTVVTVRPDAETLIRQHLPYFVGISETTAGGKRQSCDTLLLSKMSYPTAVSLKKTTA